MFRKIIGWVLVLAGGLWTLSGAICTALFVFRADAISPGAFVLMTLLGALVTRLGWNMRKQKGNNPEPASVVQPREAVQPEPKPAPVKTEQGWLFTWETGPGLCHDRFPFAAYYDEDKGLDSFRDGATCYVYNGYLSPEDTIRGLAETKSRRSDCVHVRFPAAGTVNWFRDNRYTQKLERADDIPGMDLEWTEELRALCREHNIRVVTYAGEYDLYDHVNQCRLRIHVETWYGSADDAAAYGRWSVVEQSL